MEGGKDRQPRRGKPRGWQADNKILQAHWCGRYGIYTQAAQDERTGFQGDFGDKPTNQSGGAGCV